MTVANRAIGAPINIWNDHSDAMSQRDSGWIQLYAETNQEALDLHIQAFRLAEELSLPVMVCMDGFILTHAVERVDVPTQEQVDAFLPPFEPRQVLDPAEPVTIGAMVGPEAFTEVKYLHARQADAGAGGDPASSPTTSSRPSGGASGGLVRGYRTEDAETIVVALGSVLGTIEDVVDELREQGVPSASRRSSASARIRSTRCARRSRAPSAWSCWRRRSRSASAGSSGRTCASRCRGSPLPVYDVVAGLGGRADHEGVAARAVPPRRLARRVSSELTFSTLRLGDARPTPRDRARPGCLRP